MIVLVAERRVQNAWHETNLEIRRCAMLSLQSLLLLFRSNKQQEEEFADSFGKSFLTCVDVVVNKGEQRGSLLG